MKKDLSIKKFIIINNIKNKIIVNNNFIDKLNISFDANEVT